MITYIFFFAMMSVVGYFAMVPLKAAAEYRFRGKTGLTIEGLGFLGCAVVALLSFMSGGVLTGFLLLSGGIAAGAGLRTMKGNDQRYLD
jgi:hypothetical protein